MMVTRRQARRWRARAEAEAEWFYRKLGGRVPDGPPSARDKALAIAAALASISPVHRGALSLWHARRELPAALVEEIEPGGSLVVRLECARCPAIGSTPTLEAEAVERLCVMVASDDVADKRVLRRLVVSASRHFSRAIRALAKARRAAYVTQSVPAPAESGVQLVSGQSWVKEGA